MLLVIPSESLNLNEFNKDKLFTHSPLIFDGKSSKRKTIYEKRFWRVLQRQRHIFYGLRSKTGVKAGLCIQELSHRSICITGNLHVVRRCPCIFQDTDRNMVRGVPVFMIECFLPFFEQWKDLRAFPI